MSDMLHERLDSLLDNLVHDEAYRVLSVLKASARETTETVMYAEADGTERGPFVRKRFAPGEGFGSAYRELWRAQSTGRCFYHVPRIEECYELACEETVVLEYVQGITLHEVVYRFDPSVELAVRYFPLVCDAVWELHTAFDPPIIHRDLKPSNIIVTLEGASCRPSTLTLIDFGIARTYKADARTDTAYFGTRAYAPPEQFGFGQTDERSDQYALGMILYYLLTEEVPEAKLAGGSFDDPRIPEALRAVLGRATAFDPKERFEDVMALKRAFMEAIPTFAPRSDAGDASAWEGETSARTGKRSADGRSAALGRLLDGAGIAWDILLFCAWALLIAGCVGATIQPTEAMAAVPLPLRIAEYATLGLMGSTAAFMLASKAPFAKRFARARGLTFRIGLRYGALVFAGLFATFMVLVVIQVLVGRA